MILVRLLLQRPSSHYAFSAALSSPSIASLVHAPAALLAAIALLDQSLLNRSCELAVHPDCAELWNGNGWLRGAARLWFSAAWHPVAIEPKLPPPVVALPSPCTPAPASSSAPAVAPSAAPPPPPVGPPPLAASASLPVASVSVAAPTVSVPTPSPAEPKVAAEAPVASADRSPVMCRRLSSPPRLHFCTGDPRRAARRPFVGRTRT